MNEKFYQIDEEKRTAMINSGFRNFSRYGYRKASMADMARDAGVSKALFFHYFETKKEFYLFLWRFTAEETAKALKKSTVGKEKDFFSMMEKALRAKMDLARTWPGMALFSVKAYYESDEEVASDIKVPLDPFLNSDGEMLRKTFPDTPFRKDLDLGLMYKEIYYMSEGYIWHESQKGDIDPDKMEKEYVEFLSFWRKAYLKEDNDEGN